MKHLSAASIYPVHSMPHGIPYNDWSVKWWQWLLSIPRSQNPTLDMDGSNAGIQQDYLPVVFLCQTYENSRPPIRRIRVPKNYSIFMPIINWISLQGVDGETDEEMMAIAKRKMDVVKNMEFVVNGNRLTKELLEFRILSSFFNVELPEDNLMSLNPGLRRAVSDGFWLFLKPGSESIELTSFGSCSSGQTKIGVTHLINSV